MAEPPPAPDPRRQRLEQLFREAVELHGEERAAHLEADCPDDPALRAEVSALIAAHDGGESGNGRC